MNINISKNIKKLRIEKGLTQQELADKSNISRVAIGNYERGDRIPDFVKVNQIADALGCSLMDLCGNNITSMKDEDVDFLYPSEILNLKKLFESIGYELIDGYTILNDKRELILSCSEKDLIEYSSKIINSTKDFLAITIKHLL